MLEQVDLTRKLSKAAAAPRIKALQGRLRLLQYAIQEAAIPVIVCVEGWNACGRGEVIKRMSELLDPRLYQVVRGHPPSALEARYHFLWRYQVALPRDGEMLVFDHSWYARVLEDRCDRLVKKKEWRLGYSQINEFERWLVDDGAVLLKFWLHISKKEQQRRFRGYRKDPLLRWKLTKEYYRQHKHYGRWVKAVEAMLTQCNPAYAPWTLVEAEDLHWARVKVLETVVTRLDQALQLPAPRAGGRAAEGKPAQKQRARPAEAPERAKQASAEELREEVVEWREE